MLTMRMIRDLVRVFSYYIYLFIFHLYTYFSAKVHEDNVRSYAESIDSAALLRFYLFNLRRLDIRRE